MVLLWNLIIAYSRLDCPMLHIGGTKMNRMWTLPPVVNLPHYCHGCRWSLRDVSCHSSIWTSVLSLVSSIQSTDVYWVFTICQMLGLIGAMQWMRQMRYLPPWLVLAFWQENSGNKQLNNNQIRSFQIVISTWKKPSDMWGS